MLKQQRLHLTREHSTFIGNFGKTSLHCHGAPVLFIGLSGSIELRVAGLTEQVTSALIDANTPHIVDCQGEDVAVLYIESDTFNGSVLRHHYFSFKPYAFELTNPNVRQKRNQRHILSGNINSILRQPLDFRAINMDGRVKACMRHIRNDFNGELNQTSVAKTLNISTSRLTHLFKSQTGISYRRYCLWIKLGNFMRNFQVSQDITSAAIASGFSDSSHLSNSYKKVFGVCPSRILDNLDEVVISN